MNQTENKKKELEKIINLLNVKKYDADLLEYDLDNKKI